MTRIVPLLTLIMATLGTGCAANSADPAGAAPPARGASSSAAGAEGDLVAGLALPATFTGTLPCADCPGIRYRLNLWPDGVFHLHREWLEREGFESDLGRWRKDPARDAILLYGTREMPLQFEVLGPRTLRQLDIMGRPVESRLPYELESDGALDFLELELRLRGVFTYLADAPRFEVCHTGRSYPVAMEGSYIELERAYLAADKPAPGAPLLAIVEGRITERPAMEGNREIPTVVIDRFLGLHPQQSCERAMSEASLPNTYWRILRFGVEPVPAVEGRREPHLILGQADGRYAATVGCNQLIGGYSVEGEQIRFRGGASTMMACPSPLEERERELARVLETARRWHIQGQSLEFYDEDGESIAAFEAVYLP